MTYEEQKSRAAKLLGLRPSNASVCPRVVAGKLCIRNSERSECVCQRHRKLFDHGRIWLDKNSQHVLTGEPYSALGGEVAEFLADMKKLGLSVSFSGDSMWNPGNTLLITVTREQV